MPRAVLRGGGAPATGIGRSGRPLRVLQDGSTAGFLALLLAADLALIGVHVLWSTTALTDDRMFSLGKDRGYAEMYQYIKELWAALLLSLLFLRTREGGYAGWALLFAYLLLDDALLLHERAGEALARRTGIAPVAGLEPKDLGELAFLSISMGSLLALIGLSYRRGSDSFRSATRDMAAVLLGLALFGVLADLVHNAFTEGSAALLLEVLEDGGEMVGVSALTAYAFGLSTRGPGPIARPPSHAP